MSNSQSDQSIQLADSGRIDGWTDAAKRYREIMALVAKRGVGFWFADPDFTHWPLGDTAGLAAWHDWAVQGSKHHRAVLLLHDVAPLKAKHPAWVRWRQPWSHRIPCLMPAHEEAALTGGILVVPDVVGLKMTDQSAGRGWWTKDRQTVSEWLSELDAISQRSSEALFASSLGL